MMQRALSFANSVQALQRACLLPPEVCRRLMQRRGLHGPGFDSPQVAATAGGRRGSPAASSLRELEAAAPEEAAPTPVLPLCERAAQHAVPLNELLAWAEAAALRVEAVGDGWAQQDEGPSAEDLQTELSWLLDDALAATARPGGDWSSTSWQQLERELRRGGAPPPAPGATGQLVQLREPLAWLEAVWEQRLEQRVPLQYLTSTVFWRDVVLSVGPGVLIPRPETELLIDFVQEAVAAAPALGAGAWADLGTGSGALATGVARALPQAPHVYAVDLSPAPLAYAAFNARRLGVGGRLRALRGSWYEPLEAAGVRQLAGVVSNPPYIASPDMPGLQAEVGRHEPHLALHGGEGLGIDCLLPICTGAARLLQPGGFLALETAGGEQAHYIADLLSHMRCTAAAADGGSGGGVLGAGSGAAAGLGAWAPGVGQAGEQLAFCDVRVRKDLRGVDRFVTASRRSPLHTASPPGAGN